MRILISGGGTAGHVNPALAIANYIKQENKNAVIAFAGTEKGIENKLVVRDGYKLYHIKVKGFLRKFTVKNIDALIKAFTSGFKAKKIIKEFNPDIVIGTGGYVSWPVLSAAAKMKIPTVIHEQNAYPGVTTKMLAKVVDKVMLTFKDSEKYFKDKSKLVYTGFPVKSEFFEVDKQAAKKELSPNKPMILSYGGSMGAKRINEVMIDFMDKYSKKQKINHYHATGAIGLKEFTDMFNGKNLNTYTNLILTEYFYDIAKYMAAADIIVCRTGAATLTELATLKKAAVLIPSPNVTENHQYKNAVVLEKSGAAIVMEEKDLSTESLIKYIDELLADPFKLSEMSRKSAEFAAPDALEKMYDVIRKAVTS